MNSEDSFNDSFLMNITEESLFDRSFNVSEITDEDNSRARRNKARIDFNKLLDQKEMIISELRSEITALLKYKQVNASKAIDVALLEEKHRLRESELQGKLRVVRESETMYREKLYQLESNKLSLSKDFNCTMMKAEAQLVEKEMERTEAEEARNTMYLKLKAVEGEKESLQNKLEQSRCLSEELKSKLKESQNEVLMYREKLEVLQEKYDDQIDKDKSFIMEKERAEYEKHEAEHSIEIEHLKLESLQERFHLLQRTLDERTEECDKSSLLIQNLQEKLFEGNRHKQDISNEVELRSKMDELLAELQTKNATISKIEKVLKQSNPAYLTRAGSDICISLQLQTWMNDFTKMKDGLTIDEEELRKVKSQLQQKTSELECFLKSKSSTERLLQVKISELEECEQSDQRSERCHKQLLGKIQTILVARGIVPDNDITQSKDDSSDELLQQLEKFCSVYDSMKIENYKLSDECESLTSNLRNSKSALKALQLHIASESKMASEQKKHAFENWKNASAFSENAMEELAKMHAEKLQIVQDDLLQSKLELKKLKETRDSTEAGLKLEIFSLEKELRHFTRDWAQEKGQLVEWLDLLFRAYNGSQLTAHELNFQKSLLSKEITGLYELKTSLCDLASVLSEVTPQRPHRKLRKVALMVLATIRMKNLISKGLRCRGYQERVLIRESCMPAFSELIKDIPLCDLRNLQNVTIPLPVIRVSNGLCLVQGCNTHLMQIREMFVDLFAKSQGLQAWIAKYQQHQNTIQANYNMLSQKYDSAIQEEKWKTRNAHCRSLEQVGRLKDRLMEFARLQKQLRSELLETVQRQKDKIIDLVAENAARKETI